MTDGLIRLGAIPVLLPEREILARLGYHRHRTELDETARRRLRATMERAFALCRPCGVWRNLEIVERSPERLVLAGGVELHSRTIAERYGDCRALWLGGVTVGAALPRAVGEQLAAGDGATALVFDAVGSETADAAMDFLQRGAAVQLRRSGAMLTERRFSPGYGDLSLEHQRIFFEVLELERLGLRLSPSRIMEPEKSVTALAGIR